MFGVSFEQLKLTMNISDTRLCVRLTLPMLKLLSSKAQKFKTFEKPSEHCHGGIHYIALTEYYQMSTHLPGFQYFFSNFLHHFVLAKLASSIRVKPGRVISS